LNLKSDSLSKTRAKRSSSETLIKQRAPLSGKVNFRSDDTHLFPELLEEVLNHGHSVRFRAPGNSMYPTICGGDIITVNPIEILSITIGDIILYRHKSGITAHRVVRTLKQSEENSRGAPQGPQKSSLSETLHFFLRGDAAIVFDDPVSAGQILGKVVIVERNGRRIDPYSLKVKLCFKARRFVSSLRRFVFFNTQSA
jgi:hypothetical protein